MIFFSQNSKIGRRQYTTVNDYISDANSIPLWGTSRFRSGTFAFFLLYINDLHKSPNKLQFYFFADDTSLTCANGDLKKT